MGTGNESVGIPGAGPTAFPYFSTKNFLVIKKTHHNRLQEASSEHSSVIDSFTVFFFVKFCKVKLPKIRRSNWK